MPLDVCESLTEARERYANGYYAEKLEQGLVFQDVVTRALYQRGIVVVGYASRKFQIKEGENLLGAEIKRDGGFRKTGNLYIEVAEKSHPNNPTFIPSGIFRQDNSWLFVIGDEQTIWMFSTKYLRLLHDKREWREVEKTTSIGRLMPLGDADRYCIRRIDIEAAA
ncbi:MAG: hypothetical protein IPG20_21555 [Gammaproteobacteria bacterium]|nr:hypothetical protein [Gammaproteobacteria bacterium]